MRNPFRTPFVTIFQNEVLLQSKRVAPYALMILFSANAVLWWYRGPAVLLGWASNSDFYIARCLVAFVGSIYDNRSSRVSPPFRRASFAPHG